MFPFAKSQRAQAYSRGLAQGRVAERQEQDARREAFRLSEMQSRLDAPLIVVPNEWDNPVIGFGHSLMSVGQSTVLVVENYLTMEKVWCGGVTMDFSEQRLEVVLSLDPFQLWAITAHHAIGHEDFSKPKSGNRWERKRIIDTLSQNGFFNRWAAFMQQKQEEAND